jgi:hypothetical protein
MNRENLEKLKTLQDQLELKNNFIKQRKEEFALIINSDLECADSLKSQIELYKQGIEAEALKEFKETGKKQLLGGIKIQERKKKSIDILPPMKWLKVKTETVNKVTFPKEIKLEDKDDRS